MPKVPRVTGDEAIKAFRRHGYIVDRIKGSHHILTKDSAAPLSIPVHKGRTVGTGLLSSQIKAAGLSVEEFIELLR